MKLIRLTSDNYENRLITPEAYTELTLSMSTGDWHTHTHVVEDVFMHGDFFECIITLEDVLD